MKRKEWHRGKDRLQPPAPISSALPGARGSNAEAVVLHNRDVDEPSFVQPSPPQHSVAWVEDG